MGRRKVPVKLIEDKSSRQVTFSKRRKGLIKKASEISVLCDVDVAVLVFSGSGRLYEYCSSDRYASFKTSSELLDIAERLDEPDLGQLSVTDLLQVEEPIADTLKHIRSRKTQLMMESVLTLEEQETMLQEEKKGLMGELAALKNEGNEAGRKRLTQPLLLNLL